MWRELEGFPRGNAEREPMPERPARGRATRKRPAPQSHGRVQGKAQGKSRIKAQGRAAGSRKPAHAPRPALKSANCRPIAPPAAEAAAHVDRPRSERIFLDLGALGAASPDLAPASPAGAPPAIDPPPSRVEPAQPGAGPSAMPEPETAPISIPSARAAAVPAEDASEGARAIPTRRRGRRLGRAAAAILCAAGLGTAARVPWMPEPQPAPPRAAAVDLASPASLAASPPASATVAEVSEPKPEPAAPPAAGGWSDVPRLAAHPVAVETALPGASAVLSAVLDAEPAALVAPPGTIASLVAPQDGLPLQAEAPVPSEDAAARPSAVPVEAGPTAPGAVARIPLPPRRPPVRVTRRTPAASPPPAATASPHPGAGGSDPGEPAPARAEPPESYASFSARSHEPGAYRLAWGTARLSENANSDSGRGPTWTFTAAP